MRWAVSLAAIVTGLVPALSVSGEPELPAKKNLSCVFVLELRDSLYRDQFLKELTKATDQARLSQIDQMYSAIRSGPGGIGVDYFSLQCLTCHDGMTGKSQQLVEKSLFTPQAIPAEAHQSHPMGMFYEQVAEEHKGLNPRSQLPTDVRLVDGRVGCLSCHDPFREEGNHLVSEVDAVLCLLCHQK